MRLYDVLLLAVLGVAGAQLHARDWYEGKFIDWMRRHGIEFSSGKTAHTPRACSVLVQAGGGTG